MSDSSSSPPQCKNASYVPDACPEGPNAPHAPTVDGSSATRTSESDNVIPPTHACRTLVLCFDGTGDQFDADNSNVVQFFSMLKKDDPREQMVYYQAGIGTYTVPQIATPLHAKLSKIIDLMVGNHLDAHVMDQAGDKICLFGFSRGAYTARALAGMLHKVGLLPPCNYQQVPFAYHMYSRDDQGGWKQSKLFKKAYSIDVDVEFVGVWDTVNSVGIIPRWLPFTKANNHIRFFRHALSLDEHRIRFTPSFYHQSTQADNELGVQKGEMPRSVKRSRTGHNRYGQFQHDKRNQNGHHDESSCQDPECFCTEPVTKTDVNEVWFAGCHCDVGGGSVKNGARNSLARISLRWMIREIFKAGVGILFYRSMFQQIGMDPSTLHTPFAPRPQIIFNSPIKAGYVTPDHGTDEAIQCNPDGKFVSEELEDLYDARSEVHDELTHTPSWWILEVIPQMLHFQREEDHQLAKEIRVNMGKGRRIPKREPPKVHRTVQIRMAAEDLREGKYQPKAKMTSAPVWVD
ncbi:hypothetical protein EDD15DRAFT_2409066 [Pisolithus albus]|nr:hypothetical protein EDD15DRAFT_2409066 [Pisolithus albus]